MNSVVNSFMLICAVIASLAAGVLLAYVACKGLFGLCRMHGRALYAARNAAKATETRTASA